MRQRFYNNQIFTHIFLVIVCCHCNTSLALLPVPVPLSPTQTRFQQHHQFHPNIYESKINRKNLSYVAVRNTSLNTSSTRLYKKWSPRWNPKPDSEYYRGGGEDLDGYDYIHFGGGRKRRNKYIATFGKTRLFSLQRFIVLLNIAFFMKQIQSAVQYLPMLNKLLDDSGYPYDLFTKFDLILEQFVLGSSPTVVEGKAYPTLGGSRRAYGQSLIVGSTLGPFTMDFVNQRLLTRIQPHRYLTSGFLHGSLIHLFFNMSCLFKIPRWVENNGGSGNGMSGWCLYLTTYLSSIVVGNIARDYFSTSRIGMSTLCLGASGGICGLNGLMFALLSKMGNTQASMATLKNMIFILLYGATVQSISNASHIGGFVCGTLIGWLFGPNFRKGYSSRKWNFDGNDTPLEYKALMGPGVEPDQSNLPLKYIWGGVILSFLARPELRQIPMCIWKGLTSPGILSGMCV